MVVSPAPLGEMREALELRDRDRDGTVTLRELAAGIECSLDAGLSPCRASPQAHPFERAQCLDPTLDALSFVECAVHRARVELNGGDGAAAAAAVEFEATLDAYLSGCAAPSAAWLSGDCMGSCSACTRPQIADTVPIVETPVGAAPPADEVTVLISSD
jgi:hypothetical protein